MTTDNTDNTDNVSNAISGPIQGSLDITADVTVTFDAKMDADSLANLAVGKAEDLLLDRRQVQEADMLESERNVKTEEDALRKLNASVVSDYKMDSSTLALCESLKEFNGREYSGYAYDATCCVEDSCTKFRLCIQEKRREGDNDQSYSSRSSLLTKKVELPFSDEIKAQLDSVADARKARTEKQLELASTNQMLEDLPRLHRRAKNKINEGILNGDIKNTRDAVKLVSLVEANAPLKLRNN